MPSRLALCIIILSPTVIRAQYFTRVTDVGPIVTDAFLSTGAGWNDFNDDGWPDMLALSESGIHLYVNNGDGTFSASAKEALDTPLGVGNVGAWADFDNDGDQDLLLNNFSTEAGGSEPAPNAVYRNMGPPDFDLELIELTGPVNASPSGSWVDYDQDGDLDIFSAGAAVSQAGPVTRDLFHRQDEPGAFRALPDLPFLEPRMGFGTHDVWIDYDNDGDEDLFVGNWSLPNVLYKSLLMETGNPNSFELQTESGLTDEGERFDIGSTWADYDNDGDVDVFIPIPNGANRLYQNNGDGTFTRITGISPVFRGHVAAAWGDYDNDGDVDLYAGSTSPSIYRNDGDGVFVSARTGMGDVLQPPPSPQAANWGDYDNDGDLDVYILTYAVPNRPTGTPQPNYLLRNNEGSQNHWVKVKLVGSVSNRSGVGAKIRVRSTVDGEPRWQLRYMSGGASSFVFHTGLVAHFGLGQTDAVDSLIVEWPSGILQVLDNVTGDQLVTVTEEIPPGFLRPNFYADRLSADGSTSLTVRFTDASLQDPETPIVSWSWDFDGDGSIDATDSNPTWMFTAEDDTAFSVSLEVSNGTATTTLVREGYITFNAVPTNTKESGDLPNGLSLEAFPNPFSGSTTIRYSLPLSTDAVVTVFDATGRLVTTLTRGRKSAGDHTVALDAGDLPAGTYFYRLGSSAGQQTKVLLLVR